MRFSDKFGSFWTAFRLRLAENLRPIRHFWILWYWERALWTALQSAENVMVAGDCRLGSRPHSSTFDFLLCFLKSFLRKNKGGRGGGGFQKDSCGASLSIVRRELVIFCKADWRRQLATHPVQSALRGGPPAISSFSVLVIPGPQMRGTGGTLNVVWDRHRDRGYPPRSFPQGLKRLRKKFKLLGAFVECAPQGLKPAMILQHLRHE
jgi:hypothetical protein